MKRKSVVILGIKDRSKIRECMVTKKRGCREEGETGEAREVKQGKTQRWVSMGVGGRSREDPGEIHGSTGFGVQECQRWEIREEMRLEGQGEARSKGKGLRWGFEDVMQGCQGGSEERGKKT